jgi:hypothetical protein
MNCLKCGSYFPSSMKIEGVKRPLNHRKFCLSCSPYKQHNTRSLLVYELGVQKCSICEGVLSEENSYKRKNRKDKFAYCKSCTTKYTIERSRQLKLECIEYKGGKCQMCGYNKYPGALEFHHRDPSQKDFAICKRLRSAKLNEKLKQELDKCDLLCANCHREVHFDQSRGINKSN